MSIWFWMATVIFAVVSVVLVLIILVQRPQGGGLAGAFGGAGGAGAETVFGGRVGDALTYATVTAFVVYLGLAIALSYLDETARSGSSPSATATTQPASGPIGSTQVPQGATQTQPGAAPIADTGSPPATPDDGGD